MGRLKRFGSELKKVLVNIGNATEKTLKGLDNPQMRKMDEDLNKVMRQFE